MKNILEFLEKWGDKTPEKVAIADGEHTLTYRSLLERSRRIGSALLKQELPRRSGVAIIMDRGAQPLAAMLGAVYAGSFYIVIDPEMPTPRVQAIFDRLRPSAVIADPQNRAAAEELDFPGNVWDCDALAAHPVDEVGLERVRRRSIDTDPVYALFTSGSSGVPKGAVIHHRNLLAYSEWVAGCFGIDSDTVFGNQTPFYFSMSVLDIFTSLRCGATLTVIPKKLFAFPLTLIEFLNEHKVNTLYWVPSALSIVANSKVLDYAELTEVKRVLFAGEVMPTRPLNHWIAHLPDALYANLYGPTETTDICAYYIVDRSFADDEPLPIGRACDNCEVLLLKEDGTEAGEGETGELCVRGSFLACGYYNEPEKTAAAFTLNPLNSAYPEMIYHTGDLARYNERGELMYLTRKDFQIKHMGYRIELGEIETAAGAADWIKSCVCVYDGDKDHIILIYEGKKRPAAELLALLERKLPRYMIPDEVRRIGRMPTNQNGKLDRKWLKANYETVPQCE